MADNIQAPVITLDGPGGAGKGTLTQLLANHLSWRLLDSGALYRLTALGALKQGVSLDSVPDLVWVASQLDVEFRPSSVGEPPRVFLAGEDVTAELRTEETGRHASSIATIPEVRAALLQRQRDFRQPPGLIADGRDMGTVVFPDAPCKIFLTASVEERARRRYNQLNQQGLGGNLSALLKDIAERDRRDSSRSVAPLRPAEDATILDTTGIAVDEV